MYVPDDGDPKGTQAARSHPARPIERTSYPGDNTMKITLLATVLALTFAAAPAFAGEGNGDPFPNEIGNLVTAQASPPALVASVGTAAQANVAATPSVEADATPVRTAVATQPAGHRVTAHPHRHVAHPPTASAAPQHQG